MFLHTFGDAGGKCWGICSYVRYPIEQKAFASKLISANSKLSPPKPPLLSTPRRELNAAYLAVEKSTTLATILQIPKENVFIHIDSLVVYWWIRTPPELLKTYVSNRVRKIQNSQFQILFVKGNENPSDLVSKDKPAQKPLSFWLE